MFFKKKKEKTPKTSNRKVVPIPAFSFPEA